MEPDICGIYQREISSSNGSPSPINSPGEDTSQFVGHSPRQAAAIQELTRLFQLSYLKTGSFAELGINDKSRNLETDPVILARRQKQIEYGKDLHAYKEYRKRIMKDKRAPGEPRTPNKSGKYSRRQWDGAIKKWKKRLHLHFDNGFRLEKDADGNSFCKL